MRSGGGQGPAWRVWGRTAPSSSCPEHFPSGPHQPLVLAGMEAGLAIEGEAGQMPMPGPGGGVSSSPRRTERSKEGGSVQGEGAAGESVYRLPGHWLPGRSTSPTLFVLLTPRP